MAAPDLQTRIATLETMLGQGIARIRKDGEEMEFASMADVSKELARLKREVAAGSSESRTSYATFQND